MLASLDLRDCREGGQRANMKLPMQHHLRLMGNNGDGAESA
jgi:hypothetical protein